MLQSELIDVWQAAAKLHNAKVRESDKARGVASYYGLVPETLTIWEQSFLYSLYQRQELDDLLSGTTRHARFGEFAVANYSNWSRHTERELYRFCGTCEALAAQIGIKLNGDKVEVLP